MLVIFQAQGQQRRVLKKVKTYKLVVEMIMDTHAELTRGKENCRKRESDDTTFSFFVVSISSVQPTLRHFH